MLRVGVTSREDCRIAGTSVGSAPISRKVFPSTRTRLTNECSRCVQWRVGASVKLSDSDQMLRYGLKVTNGTAGGRNGVGWEIACPTIVANKRMVSVIAPMLRDGNVKVVSES